MQHTSVFRHLLFLVFKHKAKIFCITLVATALAIVVTSRSQYLYEASASILVKFNRDSARRDVTLPSSAQGQMSDRQGSINNEIEILTSQELIEQVIATSGVGHLYPDLVRPPLKYTAFVGRAAMNFREHLSVQQVESSDVIRAAFQHRNPRTAAEVVNLLIQLYKSKHQQMFSTPTAVTFLENQVSLHHKLLQDTEKQLETFKQTYGTHSLEEERTLLLRQRAELSASHQAIQSQIAAFEQRLEAMQEQRDIMMDPSKPGLGAGVAALNRAQSRLGELRRQERELLKRYKDEHPNMIQIREDMRLARVTFQRYQTLQANGGAMALFQEIESDILKGEVDLQALRAQNTALVKQAESLNQALLALTQQEREFHDLQRQLQTHEQNYATTSAKLEAARLADEMNRHNTANISVIEPATTPLDTVGVRKEVTLGASLLLGLFAGLAVAFYSERMNQKLSTPDDIERRLGLTALASVARKKVKTYTLPASHIEVQTLPVIRDSASSALSTMIK